MTLKDIAKEAGVSISTVSRIINGNSSNAASKEMQDKIWSIARAGGYVPNTSAQALKQKNRENVPHHSIACVYARAQDAQNDAFFSTLTRSIEQEALKEGYIVKYSFSTFDIHNPATQNQIINNEVDGAAILGRCNKETLKFMKKHFHKIIYVGLNPLDIEYDQVICDGNAVASDAVSHLIAQGHTQIGYIGETKNEIRYEAYCNTLKKNHINFNKNIVTNVSGSSEAGYQGAKRILERSSDVTAFFCMNDITAIGAIRAIHECGYRIPDDISVISMDDIEIAQYVSPMLTTMHIPIEEMGKMTAKILIDRIRNGHTLPLKMSLPYYMAKRGITYVLAHAFGIIPVVTDNPDYIRMFKVKKEKELAEAERKRAEREIEVIYEKYAPYLKYDVKRRIKNRQFKKRKRLERKNRPPRPYIPPQRTAEEQKAIDTEMKRLYKEYHVSAVGRMARHLKEKYRKQ